MLCAAAMQLDRDIQFLINREWTHPALDWLAACVTVAAAWPWILAAGMLGALLFGGRRARATSLVCLAVFLISDGLPVRGGKRLFGRARPREVLVGVRSVHFARESPRILALARPLEVQWSAPTEPPSRPRSFPSGHAWHAFALATAVAACYRRRAWLLLPAAAVVAWSRVYLGAHWPSDVVLSACLAVPTTLGILHLLDLAWRHAAPRVAPRLHESMPRLPAFRSDA